MESLYSLKNYIKNDFILFESDIIYENKALNSSMIAFNILVIKTSCNLAPVSFFVI